MAGVRVLTLDGAALLAGAGICGENGSRVPALLADLLPSRSVILLVDDELYQPTVRGGSAGGGAGAMPLSEMLQPSLARGELSLPGATTAGEYRRHVESDSALARRFTPVYVEDASVVDALNFLCGLTPHLEAVHGLPIRDAALGTAAAITATYVRERRLLDAAMDLLNPPAARLRLVHDRPPAVLVGVDRALAELCIGADALRGDAARGVGRADGRGGMRAPRGGVGRRAAPRRWRPQPAATASAASAAKAAAVAALVIWPTGSATWRWCRCASGC